MYDLFIVSSAVLLLIAVVFWDLFLFKQIHKQSLYKSMANKLKHITTIKKPSAQK